MSFGGGAPGFSAIQALIEARGDYPAIADKDWATAAGLIVKKLLTSAGQSDSGLIALRAAVGAEIFDTQLKTLSHHQAKQLARRLDKAVSDFDVSTARAAIAHISGLLAGKPAPAIEDEITHPPADEQLPETTETLTTAEPDQMSEPVGDDTPPSPPAGPNPYFGRKSFRTG